MLDSGTKFPQNPGLNLSDHTRIESSSNNYGGYRENLMRSRASETIGAERKMAEEEEESGVCTPPLWRSSSPPSSPPHRHHQFRSLSPSSRAQAIARGQKELMEMVSRMPEGCYELSLKDLVEHPMVDLKKQENLGERFSKEREKEKKNKLKINRSGSLDNGGFLLKTFFPVSWSSVNKKKKKKGSSGVSGKDGRVSPKPLLFNERSGNSVDNDWWKNRYSGESESGGFSSNSGSSKSSSHSSSSRSSSRNSSRHVKGGCCCFIFSKKGMKPE